jgi:Suppressor of fused protein (SUFU)
MTPDSSKVPTLVRHIEERLGPVQEGWRRDAEGKNVPFLVARLGGTKELPPGSYFSTLGLSDFPLRSRRSEKQIRMELLMTSKDAGGFIPGVLQQVGRQLIESGSALLRGDVIGPRDPLAEGSELTALYAAIPVYFPPGMDGFESERTGEGVFVWLVPISTSEAEYIRTNGWSAFEDRLEEQDPDLADLRRRPISFDSPR